MRWRSPKNIAPVHLKKYWLGFFGIFSGETNILINNIFFLFPIDGWEDGDVPFDVHQDGLPNCPFVRDQSIENIANNRFSCPYR